MIFNDVAKALPKELIHLSSYPVWVVITKNSKFTQTNDEAKYFGFRDRNDPKQHMTLTQCNDVWKDNSVLTLSVTLANKHLMKKLNFIDVDFYAKGYSSEQYDSLLKQTWVGVSPSTNGAHVILSLPHNYTISKAIERSGYDFYENQYLTFGDSSNNVPILECPMSILTHEQDLSQEHVSGESTLIHKGRMSVPFVFNATYSLTEVLLNNGCILHRNGKYKHPNAGGAGAIRVQDATQKGREGQQVALVFHGDSMPALCATKFNKGMKHKDAFELQAWFDNPEDENYYSKGIQRYASLPNPNDVKQTVNDYNKGSKIAFTLSPCEPIQRMIDAYADTISTPIKPFLTSTVYSHLSLFMQGTVKMPLMALRSTNTLFMLLAFSAAGKDNNVSIPTVGMGHILMKRASKAGLIDVVTLTQGMIHRMPKVTSLSALLKALEDTQSKKGRVWMDTDCKDLLEKFQGNSNSHGVSQITDAIIEIADGIPITSMQKASEKLESYSESIPVLLSSQTDVALDLFTEELMARGFFGRFDFILHKDDKHTEIINPFVKGSVKPFKVVDEELLDYLIYCLSHASSMRANQENPLSVVALLDDDARESLVQWFQANVSSPSSKWSEDRKKFISRVSMSIEKMATIDAWAEHMWVCFKKQDLKPYDSDIVIRKANVERYYDYALYQVNVRNGEVLSMIKNKKASAKTKLQVRILEKIKDIVSKPNEYVKVGVKVQQTAKFGVINKSVLGKLFNEGDRSFVNDQLNALIDMDEVALYKKGSVIVNKDGDEIKLSYGDMLGMNGDTFGIEVKPNVSSK